MKQEAGQVFLKEWSSEKVKNNKINFLPLIGTGLLFLTAFLTFIQNGFSQEIPIGTWRTHFSYNNVLHVEHAGDLIYAASENGLFFFDKSDNSVNKISKIDGLQGEDISVLYFDKPTGQLLIGYASGNMDIIRDKAIINFDFVSTSQITGPKGINNIIAFDGFAFIATNFGVLKFDLSKLEVNETYREIGVDAREVVVYQQVVYHDSLFLATEEGIIAANLGEGINLLDYRNWRRYGAADNLPEGPVHIITSLGEALVAGIDDLGLYQYKDQWNATNLLENRKFKNSFRGNGQTLIVDDQGISMLTPPLQVTSVENQLITSANAAIFDEAGSYWIGDVENGLLSNYHGSFENYNPSGPYSNQIFSLSSYRDIIYGAPGGYTGSINPLQNEDGFYKFQNGVWTNFNVKSQNNGIPEFKDITDVAYNSKKNTLYAASAGYGLLKIEDNEQPTIIDENTPGSTLINLGSAERKVIIPTIAIGEAGVWVVNYGVDNPLQLLGNDGSWTPYSFSLAAAKYATGILLVGKDVWMKINPAQGGIIAFDPESNNARYLTDVVNNGGLASDKVNSLALDKNGYVWVGTDQGISIFTNPLHVFSGSVDALEPVFESQFLLRDEKITAIKVDGGNRKWIGSENGVWLFNPDADEQLLFFNTENSPLPDNKILDIEINVITGEVFFATPSGIVSYRGSATEAVNKHSEVKVFPNPVTSDFKGTVGISGLAQDAIVKITDISGKLIWQTKANGGTATWGVSDYKGSRARTGIYLVFSSTADGEDTFVTKIAVID